MFTPVSHTGRKAVRVTPNRSTSSARRPAAVVPHRQLPAVFAMLVGSLAISTVAGCGGNGVHAQTGPTTDNSPTVSLAPSTPSTPPPVPTPRQRASVAAVAQVRRYEEVLDDLSTDSKASLNKLSAVSTSPDLAEEVGSINRTREARDRVVGHSRVTGVRVDTVTLPSTGHGTKPLPTVRVSLCLNVAHVRAFDRGGHSIVPKSRKPYFLTMLTVVNRSYPEKTMWLVSKVTDREVDRCAL
jgi:hypothetical protein